MTSIGAPIALVTGANRGIGLEVCRQLAVQGMYVLLGSRDRAKGESASADLKRQGLHIDVIALDVSSADSIAHARDQVQQQFGRLDVLVNNAAIHYDTWENILNADMATVREALETNTLGAWQMSQAFVPLLRHSAHGRIVNVSSEAGSLASMGSGTPAYNLSKVGLNAITRMLASALRSDRILVNAVCPGWVATDMGGAGGRPVEQGAASVVWAVNLPDNGPTGGFFRDGKPLPW
jgi:NAD(P)-dependent dehydrogenase (short-subunit alcohol dehydrogenase family)